MLRKAILNGQLVLGEKLPATRQLALDIGISRVTAEAAYSQLEAEGYVIRKTGDGTYVALDQPFTQRTTASTPNSSATHSLSARGQRIIQGGGCQDPLTPMPFAAGSPDLNAFPTKVWQQLTQKVFRQHQHRLFSYGDPQGYAPLREALASYLAQSRGVQCHASQLIILSSSQQALQLISTLLIDEGDTVWVEDPGYNGAKTAFSAMGATLCPIPVDDQGLNWDDAPAAKPPKLIYTTPSHQYPTGAALSLPRRLALLAMAKQEHAWVIEDDYDSEFQYDARPLPALQGLSNRQRVIYIGTFSKVLFPSLRIAYMVLPPELVVPFTTARTVYDGHTPQFTQAVTAEFIHAGHFSAHIRHMRQLYKGKRNQFLTWLDEIQPPYPPIGFNGGLQLTLPLEKGSEQPLTLQAKKLGLLTPGLSPMHLNPTTSKEGWVLGYSALSLETLNKATQQLKSIFHTANAR